MRRAWVRPTPFPPLHGGGGSEGGKERSSRSAACLPGAQLSGLTATRPNPPPPPAPFPPRNPHPPPATAQRSPQGGRRPSLQGEKDADGGATAGPGRCLLPPPSSPEGGRPAAGRWSREERERRAAASNGRRREAVLASGLSHPRTGRQPSPCAGHHAAGAAAPLSAASDGICSPSASSRHVIGSVTKNKALSSCNSEVKVVINKKTKNL
ncbi:DCN1-like protein 2 isoform X4 [Lathamus discolor]|uniref:DCN1-like protein 2 isoform X4 n=1 Tax=Lathamus discolor TaxID=678569 RepID=UPI0032B8122E